MSVDKEKLVDWMKNLSAEDRAVLTEALSESGGMNTLSDSEVTEVRTLLAKIKDKESGGGKKKKGFFATLDSMFE